MKIKIKPKRPQQALEAPPRPVRPHRPQPPAPPEVQRMWRPAAAQKTPLDATWLTVPEYVRTAAGWGRRGVTT